jgi:excisionase family DNA binding protein
MANSDLLTTKQAAALLGCSRQHVVDLCESGRLPHVRIGTHRRIRRTDVERFTTIRTLRREELRSLWLHRAVAGKVVEDPDRAIATARSNLKRMRQAQPRASAWLVAWEAVLASGPEAILETLTSTSRRAIDLRQNTPFAGLLNEQERLAILSSFAANYSHRSTP